MKSGLVHIFREKLNQKIIILDLFLLLAQLILQRKLNYKLEVKNINVNNLNLLVDKKQLSKNILVKVRSTGKLIKAKVEL